MNKVKSRQHIYLVEQIQTLNQQNSRLKDRVQKMQDTLCSVYSSKRKYKCKYKQARQKIEVLQLFYKKSNNYCLNCQQNEYFISNIKQLPNSNIDSTNRLSRKTTNNIQKKYLNDQTLNTLPTMPATQRSSQNNRLKPIKPIKSIQKINTKEIKLKQKTIQSSKSESKHIGKIFRFNSPQRIKRQHQYVSSQEEFHNIYQHQYQQSMVRHILKNHQDNQSHNQIVPDIQYNLNVNSDRQQLRAFMLKFQTEINQLKHNINLTKIPSDAYNINTSRYQNQIKSPSDVYHTNTSKYQNEINKKFDSIGNKLRQIEQKQEFIVKSIDNKIYKNQQNKEIHNKNNQNNKSIFLTKQITSNIHQSIAQQNILNQSISLKTNQLKYIQKPQTKIITKQVNQKSSNQKQLLQVNLNKRNIKQIKKKSIHQTNNSKLNQELLKTIQQIGKDLTQWKIDH